MDRNLIDFYRLLYSSIERKIVRKIFARRRDDEDEKILLLFEKSTIIIVGILLRRCECNNRL